MDNNDYSSVNWGGNNPPSQLNQPIPPAPPAPVIPAPPPANVPQQPIQTQPPPAAPQFSNIPSNQSSTIPAQPNYPVNTIPQIDPSAEDIGSNLIDIADENEGETIIGRNFYCSSSGKAFILGFVLFTLFPVLISLVLAYFGGVFTSKDTDALPFVEDYASMSFFALGIMLPIMVLKMMNTIPITVESLSNVIDLDTEKADSTMAKSRLDQLVNTYSYLYCKETGRKMDGITLPQDEDLLKFISSMKLIKILVIISCVGYSILTAYNRFTGVGDTVVWHNYEASALAYISRTITDFLLAGIMGPLVLYPIILSVMITYHSLKQVGDTNSLKFIRFSKDEAGGLGEYGIQSFLNTIALLPYSVVLIGIIVQAKSLDITIAVTTMGATGVYLGLLLFVFFFPLSGAAKSMSALKRKELSSISEHYANSYLNFKKALEESDDLDTIRLHSEAMIAAETVFDGVMRQPTVPYSKALIARLFASVTPVFGTIATLFAF